jgi:hypothetical protein
MKHRTLLAILIIFAMVTLACRLTGGLGEEALEATQPPPTEPAGETPAPSPEATAATADTPLLSAVAANVVASSNGPESPTMAFDGEGILHLVWSDNRGFLHKQMTPEGAWSEAEVLTNEFETLYSLVDLIRNPTGQICVFFDAATVSVQPGTAGLYMRCLVKGQWSPIGERIPGEYAPTFAPAPAFAPDGTVQVVHSTGPGRAPVRFADTNLSPDEGFVYHLELAIDKAGSYHAMWQRRADDTYIEYCYSNDGGQTWSEIGRLTDMPLLNALSLIADEQGNVHAVGWAGERDVFYKRWTPAGGWEPAVEVTGEITGGAKGDFAVAPDGLPHIVWENDAYDIKHYVQQLADGSWSQPRLITTEKVEDIRIALDEQGGRHFVWTGGDGSLYYAVVP